MKCAFIASTSKWFARLRANLSVRDLYELHGLESAASGYERPLSHHVRRLPRLQYVQVLFTNLLTSTDVLDRLAGIEIDTSVAYLVRRVADGGTVGLRSAVFKSGRTLSEVNTFYIGRDHSTLRAVVSSCSGSPSVRR